MSDYLGQRLAGLINVTLSNLPELIILFVAIQHNQISLVQGGIIGSIIGNLLLVSGLSIIVGCKKHGIMDLNPGTVTFFLTELMLVGVLYITANIFANEIPGENRQTFSNLLAAILALAYFVFTVFLPPDNRLQVVRDQHEKMDHRWSKKTVFLVLAGTFVGAFAMSELLIGEVEIVSEKLNWSPAFLGFVALPLLGNIAEHAVAVVAAYKKLTDLSMAIALGSATQVGMVVAPLAVAFGYLTGHPVTLYFPLLSSALLALSVFAILIVLRDNKWNIREGVMLIIIMLSVTLGLCYIQ